MERSPRPESGDDAYRLRPIEPDAASASASDAGSTISTNPNSIFSNANTVRFGNVLSLEDFKGCPCPLDDIMEHEHHRDNRSASPKSVRADKTSRAESPVNHEDLDMDALEFEQAEPGVKGFAAMGVDDCADEDALLQAAVYASLNEMNSGPSGAAAAAAAAAGGGSSSAGRVTVGSAAGGTTAGGGSAGVTLSGEGAVRASDAPMPSPSPQMMSARARGKQPASAAAVYAAATTAQRASSAAATMQ